MKIKMLKNFLAVLLCAVFIMSNSTFAVSDNAETVSYDLVLLQEGGFPTPYGLEDEPKGLRETIKNALLEKAENITVDTGGINGYELAKIYEDVINHTPKLYDVLGTVKIQGNGGEYIIYPSYRNEVETYMTSSEKNIMRQAINDILAQVKPEMSTVEKILAVHDYMALHYEYDYTYSIRNAEDFFINKRGVCSAYTLAFGYIMDELDIPWDYVSSDAMNHAWNIVQIGRQWYHVDVTWDDPGMGEYEGDNIYYGDRYGYVRHSFLLISDSAMKDDIHEHYSWTASHLAKSTTYDDFFWTDISKPMQYYNGEWYWCSLYGGTYIQGGISKYNFANNSLNNLFECFNISLMDIYNNYIYFLRDNQICIAPVNDIESFAKLGEFDKPQKFNGAYFENGYLNYALADDKYYGINDDWSIRNDTDYYKYRYYYSIDLTGYNYRDCVTKWSYKDGTLTVSGGNGVIPDYDYYFSAPWKVYGSEIKSIVIDKSIKEIGENAFSDLTNLTSVSISDGLKSIKYNAFYGCANLRSIVIPDSVTNIDVWAFYRYGDLKIYGHEGSYAQAYAIENGFTFEPLPEIVVGHTIIGDNINITAETNNISGNNILFAVSYNARNKVLSFAEIEDGTAVLPSEGVKTVKIFCWNDFTDMEPLCEAKTITL